MLNDITLLSQHKQPRIANMLCKTHPRPQTSEHKQLSEGAAGKHMFISASPGMSLSHILDESVIGSRTKLVRAKCGGCR